MSIYALADPVSSEIRYVGKTRRDPRTRLQDHIRESRKPYRRQRRLWSWVRSLAEAPTLVILERQPPGGLDAAECAWIAHLTAMGCRLCNMTTGGEGQSLGYQPSEETLAKLRSYRHSDEAKRKLSAAAKGRVKSPETRAKIAAAATGRPGTFKGRKHTAESLAKMSVAQKGHPVSEETKAKISAAKRIARA